MSLPVLNWKYVGTMTIPLPGVFNGTLAWTLDTIYELGASTTYADGTARVPGSGSAWTWAQDGAGASCVAAYGAPPVNALGMRYIFAGDLVTTGYVKLAPDTGGTFTNNLLMGTNRNSGAYAGWATANPFTTASSFTGYWRMISAFSGARYVSLWESQEACVLVVSAYTTNNPNYSAQVGAMLDPLTYTVGTTCETDERLYTMSTGGGLMSRTYMSSTTVNEQAFLATPGTVNPRCGYLVPSTASVQYAYRGGTYTPGNAFVNPAGRIAQYPPWATDVNSQFLGAARNYYITRDAAGQGAWVSGSSVLGFPVSPSYYAGGDTILLGG